MARRVVRCDATTNGRRRHQLTNMDVRPGRRDVHAASTADVDAGPGHVARVVIRCVDTAKAGESTGEGGTVLGFLGFLSLCNNYYTTSAYAASGASAEALSPP